MGRFFGRFALFRHSFLRYILVGVLNTAVGFGVIFALLFLGVLPELANLAGYALGVIVSFALNKRFTFQSSGRFSGEFARFLAAMGVAYAANLASFMLCYRVFGLDKYLSTLVGGGVYTIVGYLLSRFFAFRGSKATTKIATE